MKPPARTLQGARVYLRPLAEEDAERVVRWRSQPDVASQLFSDHPPTREEHAAWFAALPARGDRLEFTIVLRAGDRPVGTIGLSRIDLAVREAEYGILLGEADQRGQGIAAEASRLLLAFAFDELRLRTVALQVFADNESAVRLYRGLGFRPNGPERDMVKEGRRRRVLTMKIGSGA